MGLTIKRVCGDDHYGRGIGKVHEQGHAIEPGHLDVEHHRVKPQCAEHSPRRFPVWNLNRHVSGAFEDVDYRRPHGFVVIDYENR